MGKLDYIKNKNPFRVPENYFEDVNNKILASVAGTEPESEKTGLYIRLRPFLAVAASLAILIVAGFFAVRISNKVSAKKNITNEISIREFADSYLDDIDLTTLELNSDPLVMSGSIPELNKAEIIDYLILENIDENEIYELL